MTITEKLLQTPNCELALFAKTHTEYTVSDLIKQLARETFNVTHKAINVASEVDFIRAVKVGVTAKYCSPKNIDVIADFEDQAPDFFTAKMKSNLIKSISEIGTHIPKMTNTGIDDCALFFDKQPKLKTGITSASFNDHVITGSKDGTLISLYGLLSATHAINNNPPASIFSRLVNDEPVIRKLLSQLTDQDDALIDAAIAAAKQKYNHRSTLKISQYHKQNFVNYNDNVIVVTPLQSALTTVELRDAISSVYDNNGRVNTKKYFAGGANTQNVSALNQDIGGGINHLTAWIPNALKRNSAFHFMRQTKNITLNENQKLLIINLNNTILRIEGVGHSVFDQRKYIDELFFNITIDFRSTLENFADEVKKLSATDVEIISRQMNPLIKKYFKADSISEKENASKELAFILVALSAAQIKRVGFNPHINDRVLTLVTKTLDCGKVLCPTL